MTTSIRTLMISGALSASLAFTGCGDDDGTSADTGTRDTGSDAVVPDGGGGGDDTGTDPDTGTVVTDVMVDSDITADTTWTADNRYVLTTAIYVTSGTLTIEPGTEIAGAGAASALVVTSGGKIEAQGTATNPIVFTSSLAAGSRAPGDWGGVVLLGLAPINVAGGSTNIEGLDPAEARGSYGGTDATHDCGTLNYVRIEWAGFVFGEDNELNGLTVGGCGSDTTLDYIQVHGGRDDGIEFFGGTANLKHAVVSRVGDDALDTDQGYQGNVQFFLMVQDARGDKGMEADNLEDSEDATPRSTPTVYNATFFGNSQDGQEGLRLRRGTGGTVANSIIANFALGDCIQVDGEASVMNANLPDGDANRLRANNNLVFGCDGPVAFTPGDGSAVTFTGTWDTTIIEADPMFAPLNIMAPNFVPPASSPAATGAAANPGGFFDAADYLGAFEPGGTDWTAGWTAFPAIAE